MLAENKFWNSSINRLYYACFYAIGALLYSHDIETLSHAGLRQKFGQLFIKTGKIDRNLGKHFSDLFEKRTKGDYNDFFDYDEETVMRMIPLSEELIDRIEKIINETTCT